MFEPMFSFFGGLFSKAKSKIIEKTLQPIIDYNFENLFEQKIAIIDLNKGISDIKLNTKYLNGIMKTNTLQEISIKFIKLEKLQLQLNDVDLILDLNTQVKQEEVLESLEVEDLVNKSVYMQIEELKKEILNQDSDSQFQNETKPPTQSSEQTKTSSKTVMFLRFIDSIFGNVKVDIKNLRIKFTGKLKSKNISSLSFVINKINCTMQKSQISNQILFLAIIDQFKLFLNDKQIGQMDNAIKLNAYLTQDTEPKIKIQAEQLQIIVSLNQLDQISQLFAQSAQVLEQRDKTIQEALRISSNFQQIKNSNKQQLAERKIINLNKYKLEEYFKQNLINKNQNQEEIFESTIIVEDIPNNKIQDFYTSVKYLNEQKEFLNCNFYGLTLYITNVEVEKQFNLKERNFKIDLENYFSISICDINVIKHNKLNIFIGSVLIYQLYQLEQLFKSLEDCKEKQDQEFDMINYQKFFCKIIMKSGKDQYTQKDLSKESYEIQTQEPIIFASFSSTQFISPIKLEIIDSQIRMDLTPFNLILDQNQLEFMMKILNIYTQNSVNQNNQQISQTQFQISKTNFSIFYRINNLQPTMSLSTQIVEDDYIQLNIYDFFLKTSDINDQLENQTYQYKNQIKFGCENIYGLDKQLQINNLNGYFGSQLKPQISKQIQFDGQNKTSIIQYLKECKSKQEQHLELQIDGVILNPNYFDNFYKMISDLNQVFNGNSKGIQPNQKKQQNIYFCTKIKIIEVNLYQTIYLCLNQFKYYFTIDYQFVLLEDLNVFYKDNSQILLMNQAQDKWIFTLIMKQNNLNLEFSALKFNLTNFNFDKLNFCIQKFINSIQYINKPQQQDNLQNKKSEVIVLFKQIMIDILPFYNEEIILQKKGQAKLNYTKVQYPSWTRSILIINNMLIKEDLIQIEEVQVYFQNENTSDRNDQLISLDKFKKIGQIQKIELQRKKLLKIDSIQIFDISKQIIIDLIDHYEHIDKDFVKKKVIEKKEYQKLDKIEMKSKNFEIQCDYLSITNQSHNFEVNVYYTQLYLGDKCCQLKISRAYILDQLQQSKFKYILDEEDFNEFEEISSALIKESLFLDLIIQFDQNSLALNVKLKPLRICLSGNQFQELLKSFQVQCKEAASNFSNDDDDESFEIIKQKEAFNLQVELFPIQFIVSFDSEGLEVEGLKTQVLKFGSFNNLILATNQVLYFYQFNQTSKQDFIQFLISQQLSTFRILFQAYSSLDITKAASSFTNGIIDIFSKPFISNNGFLYGLIEGSYGFTCGITSSLLQLTALPASALNNVAAYMGLGAISIPFSQLEEFCKKLYYKINPEKGIPKRFYKDKL
ncbi:unnamed protein product [Paramecium sonneborni]|uniref:Uncharacterized protein n=1 Tax=Paramecium sonneborni TaxID=65129 RepID=A0A8S1JXB5_9CILI|nr:unnamed protein product [Paramecium sonneborni]